MDSGMIRAFPEALAKKWCGIVAEGHLRSIMIWHTATRLASGSPANTWTFQNWHYSPKIAEDSSNIGS
jgi:hypothetical protein